MKGRTNDFSKKHCYHYKNILESYIRYKLVVANNRVRLSIVTNYIFVL